MAQTTRLASFGPIFIDYDLHKVLLLQEIVILVHSFLSLKLHWNLILFFVPSFLQIKYALILLPNSQFCCRYLLWHHLSLLLPHPYFLHLIGPLFLTQQNYVQIVVIEVILLLHASKLVEVWKVNELNTRRIETKLSLCVALALKLRKLLLMHEPLMQHGEKSFSRLIAFGQ